MEETSEKVAKLRWESTIIGVELKAFVQKTSWGKVDVRWKNCWSGAKQAIGFHYECP